MPATEILDDRLLLCCACGAPSTARRIRTLVELPKKATWDYPRSGNVLTGAVNRAVAVICDPCADSDPTPPIHSALKFVSRTRTEYVPVSELEDAEPDRTYVLVRTPHGEAILCLRCNRVSHNPSDISERYCGACHQFHQT